MVQGHPANEQQGQDLKPGLTPGLLFTLPPYRLVEGGEPGVLRDEVCQRGTGRRGSQGLCTCHLPFPKGFPLDSCLAHRHPSLRPQLKGHLSMKTFLPGPLSLK